MAVGADDAGTGVVRVFSAETRQQVASFFPFSPNYRGGVRVAVGDVNGDGVFDIVAGGLGGRVRVFNGATLVPLPGLLGNFRAFGRSFGAQVFVAAGDLTGDGRAEIVVGGGLNSPPRVRVFSGQNGALISAFRAYESSFVGGVRVAVGDVNGDGRADIITGPGRGRASRVRVFNGLTGTLLPGVQGSFLAYGPFTGGVYVAAADLNGDGRSDIITGSGGSPTNRPVRIFNGANPAQRLGAFVAKPANAQIDIRVAAADITGDSVPDIITGYGRDKTFPVRAFNGVTLSVLNAFFGSYNGSFVAGD